MKNTRPSLFESNNFAVLYIENNLDTRIDSKKIFESVFENNNIKNRNIDIFKKGFTSKDSSSGSGIGLSFVSKILEKYNWQVDVKNINKHISFNAGERFTIKALY